MDKRRFTYTHWWVLSIILIVVVGLAGWRVTEFLGNTARQEIIRESEASVLTLSTFITSELERIEGAAKSLSGAPWILPALTSRKSQNIDRANSVLDRYNSAMNASVTYLMDINGVTLASSNRDAPDSFVGKSYRFRPYFQAAIQGNPGRYYAVGITSENRGFYASYPVRNDKGEIIGVIAMKKDIDGWAEHLKSYMYSFLIDPHGVIFLSSKDELTFASLWPISDKTKQELLHTRQFGDRPFKALMPREVINRMDVVFDGHHYIAFRKVIDPEGWSVVLLSPTDRITIYKSVGVITVILICSIIAIPLIIIYRTSKAAEILRESEERFRQLADSTFEGILVHERGKILDFNQSLVQTLGYVPDEVIGTDMMDLVAPESRALVFHSMQYGTEKPIEILVLRKDGSTIEMEVYGKPIIYKGRQARVVALRDITERKQAEEKVNQLKNQIEMILVSAGEGVFGVDIEGRTIFVNPAAARMIGWEVQDLIGKIQHPIIHHTRADGTPYPSNECPIYAAYKDGSVHRIHNELFWRKDGTSFPIEYISTPMRNERGELIGAVVAFSDITERKRAEEALKERENKYRLLADNINDVIFVLDMNMNYTYVSPSVKILRGYEPEEVLKQSPAETLTPSSMDLATRTISEAMELEKYGQREIHMSRTLQLEMKRKDGSTVWTEVKVSFIRDENQQPIAILGSTRDITERKLLEEAIQEMSLNDQLTGLYNRRGFLTLAEPQLKLSDRTKRMLLFFFADMDGLKSINDTLGHKAGDQALIEMASVIKETFRSSDIIGRMGGDEFAILAIDPEEIDPKIIINRLQNRIDKHNSQANRKYKLSISIGCSFYDPEKSYSIDELMASADKLMYEQKQKKKSHLV